MRCLFLFWYAYLFIHIGPHYCGCRLIAEMCCRCPRARLLSVSLPLLMSEDAGLSFDCWSSLLPTKYIYYRLPKLNKPFTCHSCYLRDNPGKTPFLISADNDMDPGDLPAEAGTGGGLDNSLRLSRPPVLRTLRKFHAKHCQDC